MFVMLTFLSSTTHLKGRGRESIQREFLGEEGSSRIYKLRAREMNLFKPEGAENSGFLSNQTRLPRWQP